tara:strand:- start:58 stop:393 length:336 start_codon:yes stop_codon:yes gene_type:complete
MFEIDGQKGFKLTLPNGWMVSVQIGKLNYCGNRNDETLELETSNPSETAEIAAFYMTGLPVPYDREWYEFDSGDNVYGYCSVTDVLEFIEMVADFEDINTVHQTILDRVVH